MATVAEYQDWLGRARSANPGVDDSALTNFFFEKYGRPTFDEEETDDRWEITKGFSSGVDQLQGIGGGLAALTGSALNIDSLRDWGLGVYHDNMAEAQESQANVGRIEDIGGIGDALDWSMYQIGNLAPTMMTMFGTGGIGGVVGKKVAERSIKKLIGDGVENFTSAQTKQILKKQLTGQILGAYAGSAGMEAGSIYADINDETGEDRPGVALGFGMAAGLLDALPVARVFNKFGAASQARKEILENVVSQPAWAAFTKEAVKQGSLEGLTEGAQTIIERAAINWVDSNKEIFTEEGISEILNAAAAGTLMGKVMSPLGAAGERSSARRELHNIHAQEQIDKLNKLAAEEAERDRIMREKTIQGKVYHDMGDTGLGGGVIGAKTRYKPLDAVLTPKMIGADIIKQRTLAESQAAAERHHKVAREARRARLIGYLREQASRKSILQYETERNNESKELREAAFDEVQKRREEAEKLAKDRIWGEVERLRKQDPIPDARVQSDRLSQSPPLSYLGTKLGDKTPALQRELFRRRIKARNEEREARNKQSIDDELKQLLREQAEGMQVDEAVGTEAPPTATIADLVQAEELKAQEAPASEEVTPPAGPLQVESISAQDKLDTIKQKLWQLGGKASGNKTALLDRHARLSKVLKNVEGSSQEELSAMTGAQLEALLQALELPKSGAKAKKIERLNNAVSLAKTRQGKTKGDILGDQAQLNEKLEWIKLKRGVTKTLSEVAVESDKQVLDDAFDEFGEIGARLEAGQGTQADVDRLDALQKVIADVRARTAEEAERGAGGGISDKEVARGKELRKRWDEIHARVDEVKDENLYEYGDSILKEMENYDPDQAARNRKQIDTALGLRDVAKLRESIKTAARMLDSAKPKAPEKAPAAEEKAAPKTEAKARASRLAKRGTPKLSTKAIDIQMKYRKARIGGAPEEVFGKLRGDFVREFKDSNPTLYVSAADAFEYLDTGKMNEVNVRPEPKDDTLRVENAPQDEKASQESVWSNFADDAQNSDPLLRSEIGHLSQSNEDVATEAFWDKAASDNVSLFERIANAATAYIDDVLARLEGTDSARRSAYQGMRDTISKVMDKTKEQRALLRPIDSVTIEQEYLVAEDNEVVTVQENAGAMLKEADDRVLSLRKLQECLAT